MGAVSGFYLMHRDWMDHPALGGAREPHNRRSAWCWISGAPILPAIQAPIHADRQNLMRRLAFPAAGRAGDTPANTVTGTAEGTPGGTPLGAKAPCRDWHFHVAGRTAETLTETAGRTAIEPRDTEEVSHCGTPWAGIVGHRVQESKPTRPTGPG